MSRSCSSPTSNRARRARDVHTLWWAADADLFPPGRSGAHRPLYDTLLGVRVALHRVKGGPATCSAWRTRTPLPRPRPRLGRRADGGRRRRGPVRSFGSPTARGGTLAASGGERRASRRGARVVDREVELAPTPIRRADQRSRFEPPGSPPSGDRDRALARSTGSPPPSTPCMAPRWPDGALDELVALLREGHRAIDVLEALDQRGLLVRLLPEWVAVRSRPQRNAYHRFTVDRHLWEAAANAAALADRVGRPDLLVLGALFHDLGKGCPGDHTAVGMELVGASAPARPGERDVDVLVRLSSSSAAARRGRAARPRRPGHDQPGRRRRRRRRYARAAARAHRGRLAGHGPSAWGTWKAELVAELVARTPSRARRRRHGRPTGVAFPDDECWRRWPPASSTCASWSDGVAGTRRGTVVCPTPSGTFARVAGVLTLRGLDVLTTWAYSTSRVAGDGGVAVPGVAPPARRGLGSGRRRPSTGRSPASWPSRPGWRRGPHLRRRRRAGRTARPAEVTFHDDASSDATVVEVRAPIASACCTASPALGRTGLDIRHATCRRSATRWSTRSTSATRTGRGHGRLPPWRDRAGGRPRRGRRRSRAPPAMDAELPGGRGRRPADEAARFARDLSGGARRWPPIARTGLGFTENLYERERFEEVLKVASDIAAAAEEALEA